MDARLPQTARGSQGKSRWGSGARGKGRWSVMDGACDRGEAGRTTPFKGSRGAPESAKSPSGVALVGYAATTRCRENGNGYPAGGLCACEGHRPRWVRIISMTAAWSMKAMIRMGPPHWGHSRGSAS